MVKKQTDLPFGLTYGHGYVVLSELENLFESQGGSLSCRVVAPKGVDPCWMFFYVHPTGVHLDVLSARSSGPKLYFTPNNAIKFLTSYRPFFTVHDNPHSSVPDLHIAEVVYPGDLRSEPKSYKAFLASIGV